MANGLGEEEKRIDFYYSCLKSLVDKVVVSFVIFQWVFSDIFI